jgi:hypothetical protein
MLVGTGTSNTSLARCNPWPYPIRNLVLLPWANRPHERT